MDISSIFPFKQNYVPFAYSRKTLNPKLTSTCLVHGSYAFLLWKVIRESFRKPKTHIPNSSYSCVGCTLNRTYIHLDSASIDRCSDKDTPHVATRYTYIHMYVSTYVHIIPSSRELFNFEPNLISETDCVYTLPSLLLLWPFLWCSGRQLNESRQEGRPTRNPPHATPYVHWGKIPT